MPEDRVDPAKDDLARLTELCCQLGAERLQAKRMASQMLKRAHQLSSDSKMTYLEAVDYLVRLMISARNGEGGPTLDELREAEK